MTAKPARTLKVEVKARLLNLINVHLYNDYSSVYLKLDHLELEFAEVRRCLLIKYTESDKPNRRTRCIAEALQIRILGGRLTISHGHIASETQLRSKVEGHRAMAKQTPHCRAL